MAVKGIALLGPLSVGGDAAALSPRDRVVLAALAIHPGETVSAERLADALWGEHPPASWHKVIPGCILRLRRALGTQAILTTPHGYRLALDPEEVDVHQFERLLRRGRELIMLGEPERAQHTLDEALALWRGRPLVEVDGWEPGRIEGDRLVELHLETEECRLDAALRAGRHAEVLAQAQASVAKAPLRERRWALLALAQYQSGHQGEALRTLHRARTMLATDLGLDPGPELIALEQAILRQDPALSIPTAAPDPAAVCPYRGLYCYDVADAEMFFGRDAEVAECMARLGSAGVLAVVGPSGCGKSSLVRAGIGAALETAGRRPFVVTAGSRPTILLAEAPSADTVLIVDQFEEVFTMCTDAAERARFFDGLVAEASRCAVVISVRADLLGGLAEYPDLARVVERGVYLLGPMDETALRTAITGPAARAGLLLEPGLVDLLVREVEGQSGALPLLSHALRRTWERREGRTMTVAGYQATGGIRGSVAQSAEQLYESLSSRQRAVLRQVLLRLVSTSGDADPVRTRVPHRLLTDPEWRYIVERLVAARLVTADGETVQIAHESLARAWPRLSNWLEDDVEGQRILRHLSASADAWDGMDRPESELYRGTRLTHALEWQHTSKPDLTAVESTFLEASATVRDAERREAEQLASTRRRSLRRTRLLVVGVVTLLAVALTAGLLAVRQQQQRESADLAAVIAESRRVGDASRNSTDVDRALLLAVEAQRLHNSPDSRAAVAELISEHPTLVRSILTHDAVQTLSVSPDGTTLMVGEGETGTSAYSTETFTPQQSQDRWPGWTLDYRADGQQLLIVGRGSGGLGEAPNQVSAAVTNPEVSDLQRLRVDGVQGDWVFADDAAYAADGRTLAVAVSGDDFNSNVIDSAVVLWQVDDLDNPIQTVQPIPSYAIGLSPDGRLLYAASQEPALTAVDVVSGRILRSVPLPPASAPRTPTDIKSNPIWDALSDGLEVSPDGRSLAIAQGNDVVLFDAATLTEVRRLRGHSGLVRSIQFSPDGSVVVSGADDSAAIVWDTASGAVVQRLTGHAGAVLGLAFSPDGGTLYTGGADRRVLVWDLTGRRQLIARAAAGVPHTILAAVAVPSPDGRSVVYAGSTATGEDVRFLDVTTGQMGEPVTDPGSGPMVAWLPPDYHRVVTVTDATVRVRDHRNNQVIQERSVGRGKITAVGAPAEGGFVVVGDSTGGVQRITADTLETVGGRVQLARPVTEVAVGPGDKVVALLDDKTYAVVDLGRSTVVGSGSIGITPTAVAVSPDGDRLAVGGSAGEVGLLDLGSQEWITPPAVAHRQFVTGLVFATGGQTLVSSSFDGGVGLWDGVEGTSVAVVQVGSEPSASFAAIPSGENDLLVATRDGGLYRFDVRFDRWTAFACAVAGRNLTSQEWQADFGTQPYRETCPPA